MDINRARFVCFFILFCLLAFLYFFVFYEWKCHILLCHKADCFYMSAIRVTYTWIFYAVIYFLLCLFIKLQIRIRYSNICSIPFSRSQRYKIINPWMDGTVVNRQVLICKLLWLTQYNFMNVKEILDLFEERRFS